jgi:PIN domain nuclease of toxin-antitoxin system
MDILLDTHMAYWYLLGEKKMPKLAKELIADRSNNVFVNLASAWEIGIKHAKRPDSITLTAEEFIEGCNETGIVVLSIAQDQLLASMSIAQPEGLDHHDPFDRLLLGTSTAMRMKFLTHDQKIASYDAPWVLFM